MRLVRSHPHRCDRAREWVSRDLDGELSELERAVLARHLASCDACEAFRDDVRAIAAQLRAAPLAELRRPVVLPQPSRRFAWRLQAAAALAVAAVGAGSILGSLDTQRSGGSSALRAPSRVVNVERLEQEQKAHQYTWRTIALRPVVLSDSSKRPGPQLL